MWRRWSPKPIRKWRSKLHRTDAAPLIYEKDSTSLILSCWCHHHPSTVCHNVGKQSDEGIERGGRYSSEDGKWIWTPIESWNARAYCNIGVESICYCFRKSLRYVSRECVDVVDLQVILPEADHAIGIWYPCKNQGDCFTIDRENDKIHTHLQGPRLFYGLRFGGWRALFLFSVLHFLFNI